MSVSFFVTCIGGALKSRMTRDSVSLLERLGCRTNLLRKQGCRDQPTTNSGYVKEAIPGMKNLIATLEDNDDPIISSAGSCTYAIKSYPTYLADGPEWASCVEKVAVRMQGLTSFIVNTLGIVDVGASLQGRAVYHPSCSLARRLGVKDEPLIPSKNVRGLELLTSVEQDICCGFSGTFSVKMAEVSGEMVKEKIARLMEIRPEYLIGANVGCLLNVSERLQREGQKVKVMYITEVLIGRQGYKDVDQNR